MFRKCVNFYRMMVALVLMLTLQISMTGCKGHYVVIDGEETVTVKKSTIDNLYSDNELLTKALKKCKGKNNE